VNIRGIFADDASSTVIVLWDGSGMTRVGSRYENTYAWFMTLRDGAVVDGTAFTTASPSTSCGRRCRRQPNDEERHRLGVASAAGGTLDSLHANSPKRNSPAARDRIGGARARRWPAA
jgi:hypothetical protein